ncbi:MAG: ABC transporter permease subunit [Candidatus Berkelbacteria bacterium]|nr:ABC transporter permease subunit [Candidatus Berkelbacteria bacterium]
MRYSAQLHSTKKHHILKHRWLSGLVSWAWIILILAILSLVINFSQLSGREIFNGFVASLIRTTIAYLIAAAAAIIVALIITSHKVIEDLLLPIFDVLQSFPSFALFPVLVVALKNSPETVIISVLTITMIWPILFSIIGGMKNRRIDFEEAATIFGARGAKRLWNYTIPELMPSIVTGSIVGWGEGWEFIIGAELLVHANVGIGTYLGKLGQNQENLALAFGIAILLLLLYILNKILWLPLLNRVTNYSTEG